VDVRVALAFITDINSEPKKFVFTEELLGESFSFTVHSRQGLQMQPAVAMTKSTLKLYKSRPQTVK